MKKWLGILKTFGPIVLMAVPGMPAALVPLVISAIASAEKIKGASGAEKKAAVLEVVAASTASVNTLKPGLIDEPSASAAVSAGIDTVVNTVNVIDQIKAAKKPVVPTP